MKLSLSLKFVITYIVLGIAGFVLLNTEGIRILDNYIIGSESSLKVTVRWGFDADRPANYSHQTMVAI